MLTVFSLRAVRLGHVTDFPAPLGDPKNLTAISIANLFSQRLDEIRRRHDELSPTDSKSNSSEDEDKQRRHSFVSTIKRTPSLYQPDSPALKADQVLGYSEDDGMIPSAKGDTKASSRAAKWLRALGGKGAKATAGSMKLRTGKSKGAIRSSEDEMIPPVPRSNGNLLGLLDDSSEDDSDDAEEPSFAQSRQDDSDVRASSSSGGSGGAGGGGGDHIATDAAFDLQSPTSATPSLSSRRTSSPRISRAFSKRSSLVPGPALDLVVDDDQPPVPSLPAHLQPAFYARSQHVYAIHSLREYEQTVQEHDDFMASQPEGERSAVPRLPVNWPAMWQD